VAGLAAEARFELRRSPVIMAGLDPAIYANNKGREQSRPFAFVIASEAIQNRKGRPDCFVATLPCANASRLSQAMTVLTVITRHRTISRATLGARHAHDIPLRSGIIGSLAAAGAGA
jgi:hypothetical protein